MVVNRATVPYVTIYAMSVNLNSCSWQLGYYGIVWSDGRLVVLTFNIVCLIYVHISTPAIIICVIGTRCVDCGYSCHEKCQPSVPKTCHRIKPSSDPGCSTVRSSQAAGADVSAGAVGMMLCLTHCRLTAVLVTALVFTKHIPGSCC